MAAFRSEKVAGFVGIRSMRAARRQYGNVATVQLFMAAPAGLAMLVGQLLNTFGTVQTYEHVGTDGSGCYKPAALLRPCAWNRVRSNNHDVTLGVSQRGRALVNGAARASPPSGFDP